MTRHHALQYPEVKLWVRSMNAELDKIHDNGTVKWLPSAELGITSAKNEDNTPYIMFQL